MDSAGWAVGAVLPEGASKFTFLWATLALVVALLAGAMIIAMLDRWRKRAGRGGLTAGDQLSHFRRLYEEGTISREEYERIRSQLAPVIRKEMNLGPAAAKGPNAPTPPASPDVLSLPEPPNGQAPPGA